MTRNRIVLLLVLLVGVFALTLWSGRRPWFVRDVIPPPPPEFTPEGWLRFAEDHQEDDTKHPAYEKFLVKAVEHGQPVEGYAALDAENQRPGFVFLAELLATLAELDSNGPIARQRVLTPLIDRHAAGYPDDPWVTYYRARVLAQRGKYAEAEPLYAKVAASLPKRRWREPKAYWADCLARLGRWEPAYELIRGQRGEFDRIATHMLAVPHAEALGSLIERHESVNPADPQIAYFRGQLAWRVRDYPEAVKWFAIYLSGPRPDYQDGVNIGSKLSAAADCRVRGLVRLGRLEEARAAAAKPPVVTAPKRTWDAILAAKAGDAVAVLRLMGEDSQLRKTAYGDEDLGPLLRTDAMAVVRSKFPPDV